MKLKIMQVAYSAYIKGNRFIGYFFSAVEAMAYLNELYPSEEKHIEPVFVMGEDKA